MYSLPDKSETAKIATIDTLKHISLSGNCIVHKDPFLAK